MSKLLFELIQQLRNVGLRQFRISPSAAFTLAVITLLVAAIISALEWPRPAKLVPLTACGIALVAALLNLVYELFGPQQTVAARGNADSGISVTTAPVMNAAPELAHWRAAIHFAWLILLMALIALVGFIPAICLFIFAYMRWGFGEPWTGSLGYAAATTLVCWVVFDWALSIAWPRSLLGDILPMLHTATGLI